MKPLTKEDLEWLDRIGVNKERMDKIRKNQEKAIKYDQLGDVNKLCLDAEKLERIESLFNELEIPLPYDLWLVNSLKNNEIVKESKKRIEQLKNSIQKHESELKNVTVGFKEYAYNEIKREQYQLDELQKILDSLPKSLCTGWVVGNDFTKNFRDDS